MIGAFLFPKGNYMTITALPTPPSTSDPSNFSSKADAFIAALPQFVTEANAQALAVNDDAANALAAKEAALAAVNATIWASGTTYAIGDVRWSPTSFKSYRRKTNGGGTTDPVSDPTNWEQLNGFIGVTDGDKGDIVVSSSGTVFTIDNDAVTFAKMQNIATSKLLGRATSGSGDVEELGIGSGLSLSGTDLTATITSGTAATASGTSIDFTGIPSWVKRITVMFNGVSTNGTSIVLVQLGDSGGIENTGYVSGAGIISGTNTTTTTTSTAGFTTRYDTAVNLRYGQISIVNMTGNVWVANGILCAESGAAPVMLSGTKTLSETLDRIRITTVNGTDTFDAGTINIIYE